MANEVEAYAKGKDGKIPKKNDHLIDCWRYLNIALNYDFSTITESVTHTPEMEKGRFRGTEEPKNDDDWTSHDYDEFDLDCLVICTQ